MKLLIVRHAQSANNAAVEPRVADPTITDTGREQAARLAERGDLFASVDLLYVSPMRRTLETAAPLVAAHNLQARVFTGLHEWGGVWEERDGKLQHFPGLGQDEMRDIIPDLQLPDDVTSDGWWDGDLKLGDFQANIDRAHRNARQFLAYLDGSYPADLTFAVVTHGGFGSNLIEVSLDIDIHRHRGRFGLFNTGHSMVELDGPMTHMQWHNRVDHLPETLMTG